VRLPGQLAVKDETQEFKCCYKRKNVIPQRQAGVRMLTPQACEMQIFVFVGGERKTILPCPPRQNVDSALKPAFDGDSAAGTVVEGDVVHKQRCSNRRPNGVHQTVDGD
jgi:hypothetical protein